MAIDIRPAKSCRDVYDVWDGDACIGSIVHRREEYFPEPAATEWAQDEISLRTIDEAVAFLRGAQWIATRA